MEILCFVINLQGLEIAGWESEVGVFCMVCHLNVSARTYTTG